MSIVALRPSLVIANKEENREADVAALRGAGIDVLVTEPDTVIGAAEAITEVGRRLDRAPAARVIVEEIHAELGRRPQHPAVRVFVAVWRQPLLGLGSNAYGHDVVVRCGAVNVLAGRERYPEVSAAELRELAPDLILLPDEPYRFGTAPHCGVRGNRPGAGHRWEAAVVVRPAHRGQPEGVESGLWRGGGGQGLAAGKARAGPRAEP